MEYQVGVVLVLCRMRLPSKGYSMLSAVLRAQPPYRLDISIMDAFVAMRNYIMTTTTITSELAEIRAKLTLLERADEINAEAINDLSEDMRKELDNIYRLSPRFQSNRCKREKRSGIKKNKTITSLKNGCSTASPHSPPMYSDIFHKGASLCAR